MCRSGKACANMPKAKPRNALSRPARAKISAISDCHKPKYQVGIPAATCHARTRARVLHWQGDVVVWRKVFFEEKNMSELETFRAETRAWLEENCPASMRTPMPEREMPWGGRNASYPNPDTKVWMDNMASRAGRHRHGRPNMAAAGCPRKKTKFCRKSLPALRRAPP